MLNLTPERLRRVRIIALNAAFGLVVFAVALTIWFPYGRAKEVAVSMAASQDLDVEIGSAGPMFGMGVTFKDIRISTRPLTGKPVRFIVDTARIKVSPLWFFSASRAASISLDAFGGQIDVDREGTPGGKRGPFSEEIRVRDIDLKEVPGIREAINLPLSGTLNGQLEISSASGRLADANGSVSFTCESCVLGDGKTPLKIEGNPFLAGGLTLPRLRLGEMGGHIKIEKGTAKLQGIEARSPDGELALEGEVTLRDPLGLSLVNTYLRFKLSEPFLKTAENLRTILQMAASSGKRPDGSYGVRLSGSLSRLSPPVFTAVSPVAASLPAARTGARPGIAPAPVPSFGSPAIGAPRGSVAPPSPQGGPPPPPAVEEPPPPPAPAAPPPPPTPDVMLNPESTGTSVLRGVPPSAVIDDVRRGGGEVGGAGAPPPAPTGMPPPPAPPQPGPVNPEGEEQ